MASEANAEVKTGDTGVSWSFGNAVPTEVANEVKPPSSDSKLPPHVANDVTKSSGAGEQPGAVTISHAEVPPPAPTEPPVKATPGLTFANASEAEAAKPVDSAPKDEEPAKAPVSAPAPAAVKVTISANGNGSGIGGSAKSKSPAPAPVTATAPAPAPAPEPAPAPAVTVAVAMEKKDEPPVPEAPVEKKEGISAVTLEAATANGDAKKPGPKPGTKAESGSVGKKAERPKKRAATETGEPRRSKRNKA